jgi:hypothetical protein
MSKTSIYILKVALDGRRSIWRRIAIRGDQTLDDLHTAIYHAFDRFNDHLYTFYIAPKTVKLTRASARRNAKHYDAPAALDAYLERIGERKDAAKTTIASLRLSQGQVFLYLFDFGDEWWHVITVEQTDAEPDSALRYPAVIAKRGESPAQYAEYDEEEGM